MCSKKNKSGFSLIELMIAVAVISILAAIGYPSYMGHVRSAHRSDAKAALLELAQFMERQYSAGGSYVFPSGVTLPYTTVPKEGGSTYYNLSLANQTATTFTLQAAPTGSMASDSCGTLSIDQSGTKSPASDDCW